MISKGSTGDLYPSAFEEEEELLLNDDLNLELLTPFYSI
jgi:hypothetical protein